MTPTPSQPPDEVRNRCETRETDSGLKSEITALKTFVDEENKFLKNELKRLKEQRMEMKKSISDLTNSVMSQNQNVSQNEQKFGLKNEISVAKDTQENALIDDELNILKESLEQEIHSLKEQAGIPNAKLLEETSKLQIVSEESERMKKEWENLKKCIEAKLSSMEEQTDFQSDSLLDQTSTKIHSKVKNLQKMKQGLNEVIANLKRGNLELQMEVSQLKFGH